MASELELEQWSNFAPVKPFTSIRIGENFNKIDNSFPSIICHSVEPEENMFGEMITIKRETEDDGYFGVKKEIIDMAMENNVNSLPEIVSDSDHNPDKVAQPVIPSSDVVLNEIESHTSSVANGESVDILQTDGSKKTSQKLLDDDLQSLFEVPDICSTETVTDSMTTFCGVNVLQSVMEARPPVDTIIACADGKLGAHRIVMTAASKFLGQLFADQRSEDMALIILPSITKQTMISLLHLAYTGRIIYNEGEQDAIFEAMNCLLFGDVSNLSLYPVVNNDRPLKESKSTSKSIIKPHQKKVSSEANTDPITNTIPAVQQKHDTKNQDSLNPLPQHCSPLTESGKSSNGSNKKLILVCPQCPRSFANKSSLQFHTTKCHTKPTFASVGEMQMLSFCDICDRQYKTVNRATYCYTQHGLSRCLCCLGLYPTTEIREHYQKAHASVEGNDILVKCRWCPRTVSLKNHCANIVSHSNTHWANATSKVQIQEITPTSRTKCQKRPRKKISGEATVSKESKIVKRTKLNGTMETEHHQDDNNGDKRCINQGSQDVIPPMESPCDNTQSDSSTRENSAHKEKRLIHVRNLPKAFVRLDPIKNIQRYIKINSPLPIEEEEIEAELSISKDSDSKLDNDEISSKENKESQGIVTSMQPNIKWIDKVVNEELLIDGFKNDHAHVELNQRNDTNSEHEGVMNTDNFCSAIMRNNPDIYNNNELKPIDRAHVTTASYNYTSPTRQTSLSKLKVPLFPKISNPFAKVKSSCVTNDLKESPGTNWNKTETKSKDCHMD